mgnify:FL=1
MNQIKPGATVAVQDKFGTFQGMVIARKHGNEAGATFTVRGTVGGVGIEKIFPVHSPHIIKVKVLHTPRKVHRSKLYFLRTFSKKRIRQRVGRSA